MHLRSGLSRFFASWCALFWLAGCAGGLKQAPPTSAATLPAARVVTPGLFLYEVRGPTGTVHLLGTIHLGFGFEEVLTDDARVRFHGAARVITEADVSKTDPQLLMRAALLPPEQSLKRLLGEPTWTKLAERLAPQLPEPLLDRLEPWLPAVMLGLSELADILRELKPGGEGRMMDVELVRLASLEHKPVAHFETVAEQIAIFDQIPLADQARELVHALEQASAVQARQLFTAFAEGDADALEQALFDETLLEGARGFYDRVLYQRNERWLPVIERELARGGAFIAVGAAHLLGEQGILSTLARRGYSVRRVGADAPASPKPLSVKPLRAPRSS